MAVHNSRWFFLAIACLINLFSGSLFTWSVFAGPKAVQLSALTGADLTAVDLAITFAVCNLMGPIPMILSGFVNDRVGPAWLLIGGGLVVGASLYAAGVSASITSLVLSYGVFFGIGMGVVYGSLINTSVKLFPERRAFAAGAVTAAYGFCSVILPHIAYRMIESSGVELAFKYLGFATGGLIVFGGVCSLFLLKGKFSKQEIRKEERNSISEMNYRKMVVTPRFWLMFVFLFSGAFSGITLISHASLIASKQFGFTVAAAATAVSYIALVNTSSRLVIGYVADKFGYLKTLTLACVVAILGMLLFIVGSKGDNVFFFIGATTAALAYGSFMAVYPAYTARNFGSLHNSVNYSIMFCGFAAAGFIGPMVMKQLTIGDDFRLVYFAAIAALVIGLLSAVGLYRLDKRTQREHVHNGVQN